MLVQMREQSTNQKCVAINDLFASICSLTNGAGTLVVLCHAKRGVECAHVSIALFSACIRYYYQRLQLSSFWSIILCNQAFKTWTVGRSDNEAKFLPRRRSSFRLQSILICVNLIMRLVLPYKTVETVALRRLRNLKWIMNINCRLQILIHLFHFLQSSNWGSRFAFHTVVRSYFCCGATEGWNLQFDSWYWPG